MSFMPAVFANDRTEKRAQLVVGGVPTRLLLASFEFVTKEAEYQP
jgi:hypothetical protein